MLLLKKTKPCRHKWTDVFTHLLSGTKFQQQSVKSLQIRKPAPVNGSAGPTILASVHVLPGLEIDLSPGPGSARLGLLP